MELYHLFAAQHGYHVTFHTLNKILKFSSQQKYCQTAPRRASNILPCSALPRRLPWASTKPNSKIDILNNFNLKNSEYSVAQFMCVSIDCQERQGRLQCSVADSAVCRAVTRTGRAGCPGTERDGPAGRGIRLTGDKPGVAAKQIPANQELLSGVLAATHFPPC